MSDCYVYDPEEHRAWGPFADEDEANAFIESDKYLASWCVVAPDLSLYNRLPVYAPKEYHGEWPRTGR